MGLLDRIRLGTYVADADAPRRLLGGRSASLAMTAQRIECGEDTLAAVRDFLDGAGRASEDELAALIRERPALTGEARADALLAALAEHFATTRALPCPAWVLEHERFLDCFWFVSAVPGLRAVALAQTPVAFKRRGILWPARSLNRV